MNLDSKARKRATRELTSDDLDQFQDIGRNEDVNEIVAIEGIGLAMRSYVEVTQPCPKLCEDSRR